jgi:hypothetical protein
MQLALESEAILAKEHRKAQKIIDQFNEQFDNLYPECHNWRTDKNLPDRCY